MKTLNRDKIVFPYCKLLGKDYLTDDNGYKTGEFVMKYDKPKLFRASVSEGSGQTYFSKFGLNLNYAKTIRTSNKDNILPEGTILFLDGLKPSFDENGVPKGNYIIVKVIESINFVTYGVEQLK